ncbi:MAG: methylated-DNA--[protein]-cysteine S-methyltransferase [Burkholderiaceae bacterium]
MTTLDAIQQACTAWCYFDSPLGTMQLARTEHGLAGAWFEAQQHHPQRLSARKTQVDTLLQRATQQLSRYFNGEAVVFDLALDLHGTPFQRSVWQALLRIERSSTCCYGDIAAQIGAPSAARAVGAAVGRNPVAIIVPCHRVLGSSGALTGYAAGLERKVALLALERQPHRPARALQACLPFEAAA